MKPTTNPTPLPPDAILSDRKARAAAWFQDLQGQIIAAFEKAEDEAQGPFFPEATTPGRFEKKTWTRTDHTGAIHIILSPGSPPRVTLARGGGAPYWRLKPAY